MVEHSTNIETCIRTRSNILNIVLCIFMCISFKKENIMKYLWIIYIPGWMYIWTENLHVYYYCKN